MRILTCYASRACPGGRDHPSDAPYRTHCRISGRQTALHWYSVYGLPVNSIRISTPMARARALRAPYGAVFWRVFAPEMAGKPLYGRGRRQPSGAIFFTSRCGFGILAAAETPARRPRDTSAQQAAVGEPMVELLVRKRPISQRGSPTAPGPISRDHLGAQMAPAVTSKRGWRKSSPHRLRRNDRSGTGFDRESDQTWFRVSCRPKDTLMDAAQARACFSHKIRPR